MYRWSDRLLKKSPARNGIRFYRFNKKSACTRPSPKGSQRACHKISSSLALRENNGKRNKPLHGTGQKSPPSHKSHADALNRRELKFQKNNPLYAGYFSCDHTTPTVCVQGAEAALAFSAADFFSAF
jgi:hypothetical protein